MTIIASQLGLDEKLWAQYGEREETRREHLSELRAFLGLTPFGLRQFRQSALWLAELALQAGKGVILATALVQEIRREKIVLPPIDVIERICALAITRANRKIYLTLAETLNDGHRVMLEGLLWQAERSRRSEAKSGFVSSVWLALINRVSLITVVVNMHRWPANVKLLVQAAALVANDQPVVVA